MEINLITQEKITLYSKRILRLKQGENILDLGSQDIENYKKEIEKRGLKVEIKELEEKPLEEKGDGGDDKDKGGKEKSSKKGAGK